MKEKEIFFDFDGVIVNTYQCQNVFVYIILITLSRILTFLGLLKVGEKIEKIFNLFPPIFPGLQELLTICRIKGLSPIILTRRSDLKRINVFLNEQGIVFDKYLTHASNGCNIVEIIRAEGKSEDFLFISDNFLDCQKVKQFFPKSKVYWVAPVYRRWPPEIKNIKTINGSLPLIKLICVVMEETTLFLLLINC